MDLTDGDDTPDRYRDDTPYRHTDDAPGSETDMTHQTD